MKRLTLYEKLGDSHHFSLLILSLALVHSRLIPTHPSNDKSGQVAPGFGQHLAVPLLLYLQSGFREGGVAVAALQHPPLPHLGVGGGDHFELNVRLA